MKKLVILGGGYGGLTIVQQLLEKGLPDDVLMILIDRMPYQGLKTEYYALASGTISDLEVRVSYPVDPRLLIHYGEITNVQLDNQTIHLEGQDPIEYNWLVIALGCTDRYHGIPGAEQYSSSIQTLPATRQAYLRLNNTKPYGQISIIGGGLSGVEVAAELRESRPDLNIRVIDRGPSILSAFPAKLQQFVRSWFDEHNVDLSPHISLTHLERNHLFHQDGQFTSDVTIWTAGIQPVQVVQQLPVLKDSQGKVVINANHQIPTHPEVYVIGDCASLPYSPSAQLAEAQGKQAAEIIYANWYDKTPKLTKMKLKGVLGSLGKKSGFGLMGKRSIMGKVPRVLKSGVLWMSKHHKG